MQRDPDRCLKNQNLNVNHSWINLNSLPPGQREQVVNAKIIRRDKDSCAAILNGMLKDKNAEADKKRILANERIERMIKLREKHNKTYELEQACGVRVGNNSVEKSHSPDRAANHSMHSLDNSVLEQHQPFNMSVSKVIEQED